MTEIYTIGAALVLGAVGKAIGKSPITGEKQWQKILGPALSFAGAAAAEGARSILAGDPFNPVVVLTAGGLAGGVQSYTKNVGQFVRTKGA